MIQNKISVMWKQQTILQFDNSNATGAIPLHSDDTKPNSKNTDTAFADPRLESTDDTPAERQNNTGQNPHKCDKCDADFTTKQSLKNMKRFTQGMRTTNVGYPNVMLHIHIVRN